MNNSSRPLIFISLLMFLIVFGCIYFGFRPLLQHSTSGMSREIVLGLLGAGLVATVTGVLLAFERHLDTSNRLRENRFDTIIKELPAPKYSEIEPFQMLVADLDYSDYLGELAIGRVANGNVKKNEQLICIGENGEKIYLRASKIQV